MICGWKVNVINLIQIWILIWLNQAWVNDDFPNSICKLQLGTQVSFMAMKDFKGDLIAI